MINCCNCPPQQCVHNIPRFRATSAINAQFLYLLITFTGKCPVSTVPSTQMLYKRVTGTVGGTTITMERVANSAYKLTWTRVGGLTTTVNGHTLATYRLTGYEFDGVKFRINTNGTGYEVDPTTSTVVCQCTSSDPARILIKPVSNFTPGNDLTYLSAYFLSRVKATSESTTANLNVTVTPGCYSGIDITMNLVTSATNQVDGYWISTGRPGLLWTGVYWWPDVGVGVEGRIGAFGLEAHSDPEDSYGPAGFNAISVSSNIVHPSLPCLGTADVLFTAHSSASTPFTGTLTNGPYTAIVSGSGV